MSTTNTPAAPAAPMTSFEVENENGRNLFTVEATAPHGRCNASVQFVKSSGPLYFQVNLTPEIARNLAGVLMVLADTAEQFDFEATVQAELAAEQVAA